MSRAASAFPGRAAGRSRRTLRGFIPRSWCAGSRRPSRSLGVTIHEGTAVSEIRPHQALTPAGTVTARWVVRATEGYTAALAGQHRALLPMNSSMIITEPLADAGLAADRLGGPRGHRGRGERLRVPAAHRRRAAIAIGGRGVPYRYGSRTDGWGETHERTISELQAKFSSMFPVAAGAAVDHAWSGVLGVPRDWCVSVDANPATGLARAGGYVGEGVARIEPRRPHASRPDPRRATELTTLPWVGRNPRSWEPEPLRWASVHGVYAMYRGADRIERRTGRPSRIAHFVDVASGRH